MSLKLQLQIVARARQLIADPKRWTVRADARGWRGKQVDAWDTQARQFSAFGALLRAAQSDIRDRYRAERMARAIAANIRWTQGLSVDIFELNDHSASGTGHDKVLRAFDEYLTTGAVIPSLQPFIAEVSPIDSASP